MNYCRVWKLSDKNNHGAGHFHVNFTYFNIFIESDPPPENNIEKMSIKCVKFEATRAAAA